MHLKPCIIPIFGFSLNAALEKGKTTTPRDEHVWLGVFSLVVLCKLAAYY